MKEIFLMGDSICAHYYPYLEHCTQGLVNIKCRSDLGLAIQDLAPYCNSRTDLEIIEKLYAESTFRPDVILLNCGLHDIKFTRKSATYEVDLNEYRKNLSRITTFLENKCNIIWISTTPVNEKVHNRDDMPFFRYDVDVDRYNEAADEIMTDNGILKLDLHGFSAKLESEIPDARIDHVHYTDAIRRLQGAFIAGYLDAYINIIK